MTFLFVTSVFLFVTLVFLFVTTVFLFVNSVTFLFVTSVFPFVTSVFLFVTGSVPFRNLVFLFVTVGVPFRNLVFLFVLLGVPFRNSLVNKTPPYHGLLQMDGGELVPEEVFYQSRVRHPAIIELLDYFWEDGHCVMVMEKPAQPCDMLDYLTDEGPLSEDLAKKIFRQVSLRPSP